MYRFKIFSSPFFSKGAGGIFIAVILGIFAFPVRAGDGLVYGLGTRTNPEEIAGWNIDVGPDGAGLPPGSATLSEGQGIYDMKCAHCHGVFGEGVAGKPVLAGGIGTLGSHEPQKTAGSYWPHATTLFAYIRSSMPFDRPRSLTDQEVYAVTGYVLYLNELLEDMRAGINAQTLLQVEMPNRNGFVADPRPDVANAACMTDCLRNASKQ